MKKFKLILFLGILLLIGLVAYQNKVFFLDTHSINVDLMVKQYETPEIQIGLYFVGFFLVGFLISYFFSLLVRFRSKKTIKKMKAEINTHLGKISELESELSSIKYGRSNNEEDGPETVTRDNEPESEPDSENDRESSASDVDGEKTE